MPIEHGSGVADAGAGRLSVIIPVLDEAASISTHLAALVPLRQRGAELIVVDGGSSDGSVDLARPGCDQVIIAPRGRAAQMNAGAVAATGDILLFLHADTRLPPDADRLVVGACAAGAVWGRFDVCIDGSSVLLPVVARLMNLRSRLSGIATGDQAIFVRRDSFAAVGGFPLLPLMEDIACSQALRRLARPCCLHQRVRTSGRRWEKHGVLRTILLMWYLRAAFSLGADPRRLAVRYGYRPAE